MTTREPDQPRSNEPDAAGRGLRSPAVWAGVAVFLAALALGGVSRAFPFDPDGPLGQWYVQYPLIGLAVAGMLGGSWLISRGFTGRGTTEGLAEHYRDSGS